MLTGGDVPLLSERLAGERLFNWNTQAPSAWFYLTLTVSLLGYLFCTYLMAKVGPVMISTYAYENPPITLVAGVWLLNEQISGLALVATVVVLLGAITVVVARVRRVLRTTLLGR